MIFHPKFLRKVSTYITEIRFIMNYCIEKGLFSNELKLNDVAPIFKKEDLIIDWSVYTTYAKVFERILYKQIDTFMTTKFSPDLCGFRKNH